MRAIYIVDELTETGGGTPSDKGIQEDSLAGTPLALRPDISRAEPHEDRTPQSEQHTHAALAETRAKLAIIQQDDHGERQQVAGSELIGMLESISQGIGTDVSPETSPERLQEIASAAYDNMARNGAIGPQEARAITALIATGIATENRGEMQADIARQAGFSISLDSPLETRKAILVDAFDDLADGPVGVDGARDVLALLAVGTAGRDSQAVLSFLSHQFGNSLALGSKAEDMSRISFEAYTDLADHYGRDYASAILAMTAVSIFA